MQPRTTTPTSLAAARIAAVLWMSLLAVSSWAASFGTYLKPFSAQSPWNARPVGPVLGDFEIPRASYYPTLAEGKWSTGVFLAGVQDSPVTVRGLPDLPGVWDPDSQVMRDGVVIPRWPAGVLPAEGSDGHADIVDPVSGIVHSFYKLKNIDGVWRAKQYAWSRLDGRGWGDPAHYYQGARAAAVPTMAGLIRTHEFKDSDTLYRHALAMSLTFNGMSPDPSYIFPATHGDATAAKTNTGRIPEGALLMLPPEYDTARIKDTKLRKVADTLKVYGAYVVDRNVGAPFTIYVENGARMGLHQPKWNHEIARELDRIRAALRQVVAVGGWLDGEGQPMTMEPKLNLLSMRGPWKLIRGDGPAGVYETWRQAVVFPPGGGAVVQSNSSGHGLYAVTWAQPQPGMRYRLSARTSEGGSLRLQLFDAGGRAALYDSGELTDGQAAVFDWPQDQRALTVTLRGGGQPRATMVSGSLVQVDEPAPVLAPSR